MLSSQFWQLNMVFGLCVMVSVVITGFSYKSFSYISSNDHRGYDSVMCNVIKDKNKVKQFVRIFSYTNEITLLP